MSAEDNLNPAIGGVKTSLGELCVGDKVHFRNGRTATIQGFGDGQNSWGGRIFFTTKVDGGSSWNYQFTVYYEIIAWGGGGGNYPLDIVKIESQAKRECDDYSACAPIPSITEPDREVLLLL